METNGTGSIVQLEKEKPKGKCRKWQLRVSVGLDPRTGKYRQRTRTFKGTYTEAKRALPEFIDELAPMAPDSPDRMTFAECCELWMREGDPMGELASESARARARACKAACMHLGAKRVRAVTKRDAELMAVAFRNGDTVSGRPYSDNTMASYLGSISCMYRTFAVPRGYAAQNPFEGLRKHKVAARKPVMLTESQYSAMVDALNGMDDPRAVAALLALQAGLRARECLACTWGDLGEGTLHVRGTKNSKADAVLPICASLRESLDAWKLEQGARMRALGLEQTDETRIVNTHRYSGTMNYETMKCWWVKARVGLGYPDMNFHDLRHAFVTHCCRAKIHPKTIQKLARHKNFLTTMNIYAHVNKEDMDNAVLLL